MECQKSYRGSLKREVNKCCQAWRAGN